MAYERTIWKNREVERPRTFKKIENPDGTITLVPAEGNIIEPGTPIIAENMNNIEQGIVDAHDLAQQAFQSASDGKQKIATAITGKGVPTSSSDTFTKMASNIDAIETDKTGDATAVAADILDGKTAYVKGVKLTGSMPNIGKQTGRITTKGERKYISKGYHDGTGYIDYNDPNHIPSNIRKGVNIANVVGTLEPIERDKIINYGGGFAFNNAKAGSTYTYNFKNILTPCDRSGYVLVIVLDVYNSTANDPNIHSAILSFNDDPNDVVVFELYDREEYKCPISIQSFNPLDPNGYGITFVANRSFNATGISREYYFRVLHRAIGRV